MKTVRYVIGFIRYAIIVTIPIADASEAPQTDENGIYKDVNVMDIDSDTPSNTMKKNNLKKNPTADLNQFFEAVRHMNGDKRGRCQCKLST
jgi:hypothetical protein